MGGARLGGRQSPPPLRLLPPLALCPATPATQSNDRGSYSGALLQHPDRSGGGQVPEGKERKVQ